MRPNRLNNQGSARRAVTSRTGKPAGKRIRNFEAFREVFADWDGSFHQMSRGPFEGSLHVDRGRGLRIFEVRTNQAILTRGVDHAPLMTFIPVTVRNAQTVWQGHRRLDPGRLIVKHPEAGYHNRTAKETVLSALLLPLPVFREVFQVLAGKDIRFGSWSALTPEPEAMARFETGLQTAFRASIHYGGLTSCPDDPSFESQLLQLLVDVLVAPGVEPEMGANARKQLVRKAVAFMHDRLTLSLTALDVCEAMQVSDRALRRAFQESFGMGPLAYFRVMRLHAVRAELRRQRDWHGSVADIAQHWNFGRLGAFAQAYRDHFGELPSVTLGVRGRSP